MEAFVVVTTSAVTLGAVKVITKKKKRSRTINLLVKPKGTAKTSGVMSVGIITSCRSGDDIVCERVIEKATSFYFNMTTQWDRAAIHKEHAAIHIDNSCCDHLGNAPPTHQHGDVSNVGISKRTCGSC